MVGYTLAAKHALPEVVAFLVESISGRFFFPFLRAFSRKAKSYDYRGVSRLLLGEARR